MTDTRGWQMNDPQIEMAAPGDRLDGVRTRRVLAFILDYALVIAIWFVTMMVLGLATLGIAFFVLPPLGVVIALLYIGLTLSGEQQATWGMRFFSIRLNRLDGAPIDFWAAILHAILFWACNTFLTPFVLLVSLFTARKQLLHDLLLGTVAERSDRR
jgi:uncharacterized RDD family membrane protein YckC